jgi:hypothetical protein
MVCIIPFVFLIIRTLLYAFKQKKCPLFKALQIYSTDLLLLAPVCIALYSVGTASEIGETTYWIKLVNLLAISLLNVPGWVMCFEFTDLLSVASRSASVIVATIGIIVGNIVVSDNFLPGGMNFKTLKLGSISIIGTVEVISALFGVIILLINRRRLKINDKIINIQNYSIAGHIRTKDERKKFMFVMILTLFLLTILVVAAVVVMELIFIPKIKCCSIDQQKYCKLAAAAVIGGGVYALIGIFTVYWVKPIKQQRVILFKALTQETIQLRNMVSSNVEFSNNQHFGN